MPKSGVTYVGYVGKCSRDIIGVKLPLRDKFGGRELLKIPLLQPFNEEQVSRTSFVPKTDG